MGLIKAAFGSLGGTFADQWKEFFYCDSLDKDVLVKKGTKRTSSRSSNTKGNDNVITNGSGIAVADGQCMIIVEQGKVVEVCAEPGEFTYDASTEPSIFTGSLGQSILDTFKTIGKRFTYGGDTGKDQRIYYFNTKEIIDNKFGTPTPIPFRVVDSKIGLDVDVSVRCNGVYSYKITNPILFYTNVCGNVEKEYLRSDIDSQMKSEFLAHLSPSFAKISTLEIRPNQIPAHNIELGEAIKEELTPQWTELRGISIINVAIISATIPEEDQDMINELQRTAVMRDPNMAAARLVGAQAEAMKAAANNENGAMMGFMGMGMANQAGGMSAQSLFEMSQKNNSTKQEENNADSWECSCGNVSYGKFCTECGAKRVVQECIWKCPSCGKENYGKFCSECGTKKPQGVICNKCGWESNETVKFCPECGNKF